MDCFHLIPKTKVLDVHLMHYAKHETLSSRHSIFRIARALGSHIWLALLPVRRELQKM